MPARRLHDEIYMDLRAQILDGTLEPGACLPTFTALTQQYGVSVATINKSIARLKADGLVRAIKSKGVFVADEIEPDASKGVIGAVLPEIRADVYMQLIHGIMDQAEEEGFSVHICRTDYDAARELEHLENLSNGRKVKGIICSPEGGKGANDEFFRWLLEMRYPFVFVDRYLPKISASTVCSDSVYGARIAVEHLLEQGHRRIAFLTAEDALDHKWCIDRLSGYRQALEEAGLTYDKALVGNKATVKDVRRMLGFDDPPTALFLASNRFLANVLEAAEKENARIGHDLTVAGFDEVDAAIGRMSPEDIRRYLDAPLIKVIQPFEEIGKTACELLTKSIRGEMATPAKVMLRPELVV